MSPTRRPSSTRKTTLRASIFPRQAIDALKDVKGIAAAPKPATAEEPPLPATYTVRLNMEKRDCFWRIARVPVRLQRSVEMEDSLRGEQEHHRETRTIPNLIEPGQVFTIPSLQGETREGDYDPAKTYTPLSPK